MEERDGSPPQAHKPHSFNRRRVSDITGAENKRSLHSRQKKARPVTRRYLKLLTAAGGVCHQALRAVTRRARH